MCPGLLYFRMYKSNGCISQPHSLKLQVDILLNIFNNNIYLIVHAINIINIKMLINSIFQSFVFGVL